MPDQNQQFVTRDEYIRLKNDFDNLSQQFFKNNFSSNQTFTKDAVFQTRLRVPVYTSAPAVAEVGDLICVAAKLYVCTTAGSVTSPAIYTLVGSQS